jgi:hypothetical protein
MDLSLLRNASPFFHYRSILSLLAFYKQTELGWVTHGSDLLCLDKIVLHLLYKNKQHQINKHDRKSSHPPSLLLKDGLFLVDRFHQYNDTTIWITYVCVYGCMFVDDCFIVDEKWITVSYTHRLIRSLSKTKF